MTKDELVAHVAEFLWLRGMGSRKANPIAAEELVGWLKHNGLIRLNGDVLQQAIAAHEREKHEVLEPRPMDDDCIADVKARYDALVLP